MRDFFFEKPRRENFFIFLFFLLTVFFLYRNCFHIFIPADNYSQLFWFEKGFVDGCLKSAQEPTPPHFLWFPIFSFLYSIFKLNSICWISISLLIHSLNAFIVFLFVKRIFLYFFSERNFLVAFFTALIFLVSPYQTEDVLWSPISVRWLLNTTMICSALFFFLLYLNHAQKKKIVIIHFLFLSGIFLNES